MKNGNLLHIKFLNEMLSLINKMKKMHQNNIITIIYKIS